MLNQEIASLEQRQLAALAATAGAAALEQQAKETVQAHRAAIARLKAAEKRLTDAELAQAAGRSLPDNDAEVRRLEEALAKARAERQAKVWQAEIDYRAAQNAVRTAIAEIQDLQPWHAFDDWRTKVEQTIRRSWVPPLAGQERLFELRDRSESKFAENRDLDRSRTELEDLQARIQAHEAEAAAALLAFREVLNSARLRYATESEAFKAARAALEAVKEFYALSTGVSWPA